VNCSDCNKQIDPYDEYDEPVMCFLIGERMEYTCEDCSEDRGGRIRDEDN
jgi:DNA-directed RNA polymerase subunit RPC12/RpoP